MADGFKISINRGQQKPQFTIADAAPGTANIEILVDHTAGLEKDEIAVALHDAARLILERVWPPA